MMKKIVAVVVLMCGCIYAYAHDFVVTIDAQKIYFSITSEKNQTVEITYKESIAGGQPSYFEGELTIPAKVKHNNKIYAVVGIGAKAFSGADKLTGVIIPAGLKTIGDFAFEGCAALNKIIFPGNEVKFGQGVFFKCNGIRDVSLGSDWKSVDFRMFRWSDSLAVITIPAKIEKIQNLKSIKCLHKIYVDSNNEKFSSVDGILYNKSEEVLYCCPRGYVGNLKVSDASRVITPGSLIDCPGITRVDLPENLTSMSFKEFSRMGNLNEIIFRNPVPVHTAVNETDSLAFFIQVRNQDVKIIVRKDARKNYQAALVSNEGEYREVEGTIPFYVSKNQIPTKNNIVGVKSFDKYE